MKKLGLIGKLIIAIALGVLIGAISPEWIVRGFATYNSIFGNFLGFVIPLIIIGFVVAGIADLGTGAGKLLGITTGLAYLSTIISGIVTYLIVTKLFPVFISTSQIISNASNPEEGLLAPFIKIEMPPVMGVMSALLLAFLLGLGIAATNATTFKNMSMEFQKIVEKTIASVIIPLLPLHIMGIFANMTYAGEVGKILSVFWKVFIIILLIHFLIIVSQFSIACLVSKKNLVTCIKNQIPGYLAAIGTQSSAAAIPVNLECAKKNGVSKGIREFVIPLCATIHLSGSTITLTACSIAIMMLNDMPFTFAKMLSFIAMLGVTMVAAPGVPGGAVMAALATLQSILGFGDAQLALMIALYITQDSFGTACNVAGDNAIAILMDKFSTVQRT